MRGTIVKERLAADMMRQAGSPQYIKAGHRPAVIWSNHHVDFDSLYLFVVF